MVFVLVPEGRGGSSSFVVLSLFNLQGNRAYSVDRRGFLLGEKHPEIGPSGNDWSYYTYDALGNVLSRTIAGSADFDLDFRYDKAARLIKLIERNGPNGPRPLKEFFYGHQNAADDKRAGKLYMSRRHNWVDPVGPLAATGSLDLVVTQTYFYEGLDGRVSKRLTSLKVPQITTYAFETDFTWTDLGLIDEIGYPQCLHARCTGRDPPRTISHGYSRGFLTAVPDFASSIAYQGAGMLHQVQHTNGVTYSIEGCRQLARLSSKLSAQEAEPLAPIVAVESETDDLILGESRSLWLPEAAERKDCEINRYLDRVRGVVLETCEVLVQKYGCPDGKKRADA